MNKSIPLVLSLLFSVFVAGCDTAPVVSDVAVKAASAVESTAKADFGVSGIAHYPLAMSVPASQMTLLDEATIAAIGGSIVAGNPTASIRVDYVDGPVTGGVFEVTRGTVRIVFPFHEHATVLNGVFRSTDVATGMTRLYTPGDSYIIEAGTEVIWEVLTPKMQKSFLNVVPTF